VLIQNPPIPHPAGQVCLSSGQENLPLQIQIKAQEDIPFRSDPLFQDVFGQKN